MTREEQLFSRHWPEFMENFPFMKDHVVWVRFDCAQAPEMALDAKAVITFLGWCLTKGYGNRGRLREILQFFEEQTGGISREWESSPA